MTQTDEHALGDRPSAYAERNVEVARLIAMNEAKQRHPSRLGASAGCGACSADGRGRVELCADHIDHSQHRCYVGIPVYGPCDVVVTQSVLATGEVIATWPLRPLSDSQGFAWGYQGRGASLLADAILRDALGELAEPVEAVAFRDERIATIDIGAAFEITQADVLAWAYEYRGQGRQRPSPPYARRRDRHRGHAAAAPSGRVMSATLTTTELEPVSDDWWLCDGHPDLPPFYCAQREQLPECIRVPVYREKAVQS